MDWTNVQQILQWLVGVGAPALVMYLVSWLVENWSTWATLPRAVKFLGPMILSVLVAFGASTLLKYPDIIATIQPTFQVIASAVLAYLASQKAFMSAMKAGYGKRFAK